MITPSSPTVIFPLTSLRGGAALAVLLSHLTMTVVPLQDLPWWMKLCKHGYLGVDIFFILSGFILSHGYGVKFSKAVTSKSYKQFMLHRIFRIYPLYLTFLSVPILSFIISSQLFQSDDWKILFYNVTLTGYWFPFIPESVEFLNPPAWTISIEMLLYLLLPFGCRIILQRPRDWLFVWLLLLGVVFYYVFLTAPYRADGVSSFFTPQVLSPRVIIEFFLGIGLYGLYRQRVFLMLPWKLIVSLVTLLIIILPLITHNMAYVMPLLPCLIYGLAQPMNARHFLWGGRPMIFLGEISYSLYLLQGLMFSFLTLISQAREQVSLPLYAGLVASTILGMLCLATLTYRYIELPSRRYVRQLHSKKIIR